MKHNRRKHVLETAIATTKLSRIKWIENVSKEKTKKQKHAEEIKGEIEKKIYDVVPKTIENLGFKLLI